MDLKKLSDDELIALYQKTKTQPVSVDPDAGLGGTVSFAGMNTGIPIPKPVEAALVSAGKTLTGWGRGAERLYHDIRNSPEKSASIREQSAADQKIYDPLQEKYPLATLGGEIAPYLAVPAGPAGMAALGFIDDAPTYQDRFKNAALAGVGAKLGQFTGRMFGAPSMGKGGNKWDIPLSVGQETGNKTVQTVESVLSKLPLGGAVRKGQDRTNEAFRKAITRQFGNESGNLAPEALGAAKTEIGNLIGRIAARNNIKVDPDLFKGLQAAAARAGSDLTEEEAKIVNAQIQKIWRQMDPTTGAIPGTLYKATQNKLGEMAKNRGGTFASVIGDIRTSLREAMTRSVSPDDSRMWLEANERYFNVKQVGDAMRRTPNEISPASLLTQVNDAQKASRFGGGNELAELARFAQQHIGAKIPDSASAQRGFYQNWLSPTPEKIASYGLLGTGVGTGAYLASNNYGPMPVGVTAATAAAVPLAISRFLAGKPVPPATMKLLESIGAGLVSTKAQRE